MPKVCYIYLIVSNVVILWVNTNFTRKGWSFVESFYYLSFTAQQRSYNVWPLYGTV